jgi:hypothetical protein
MWSAAEKKKQSKNMQEKAACLKSKEKNTEEKNRRSLTSNWGPLKGLDPFLKLE